MKCNILKQNKIKYGVCLSSDIAFCRHMQTWDLKHNVIREEELAKLHLHHLFGERVC